MLRNANAFAWAQTMGVFFPFFSFCMVDQFKEKKVADFFRGKVSLCRGGVGARNTDGKCWLLSNVEETEKPVRQSAAANKTPPGMMPSYHVVFQAVSCLLVEVSALPCLALPCLALPCLALPCLALPCLALPCLALPCLALPCLGLAWLGLALSWLGLACRVLACRVLACRVLA